MYSIQKHPERHKIELLRNNNFVADFDNYNELLDYLLDNISFADELYGNKVIQQLALTKREYPELRLGQLVINAIIEQGKYSADCLFTVSDEDLISGLRKLFERKLIPFSEVLRT